MSGSLLTQIETMSRYNRLANETLYQACAGLPAHEIGRERGAFFSSILGTLNHILLMDRVWVDRFTATEREVPPPNTILYHDFHELRAARAAEDTRIEEFVESLNIAFLSSRFRYKDIACQFRQDGADLLVLHFFNHQTHHRGQVHHMLTEAGAEEISLDLHRLIHP